MPETMSAGYAAAEREAYRSVRRACDAGLDSTALRVELARRVMGLIPAEASFFGSLNRVTALLDDLVGEDTSTGIEWHLLDAAYSRTDAERAIDLARSGEVVDTGVSAGMSEWMHDAGFGRQLRAASTSAARRNARATWGAIRRMNAVSCSPNARDRRSRSARNTPTGSCPRPKAARS